MLEGVCNPYSVMKWLRDNKCPTFVGGRKFEFEFDNDYYVVESCRKLAVIDGDWEMIDGMWLFRWLHGDGETVSILGCGYSLERKSGMSREELETALRVLKSLEGQDVQSVIKEYQRKLCLAK